MNKFAQLAVFLVGSEVLYATDKEIYAWQLVSPAISIEESGIGSIEMIDISDDDGPRVVWAELCTRDECQKYLVPWIFTGKE